MRAIYWMFMTGIVLMLATTPAQAQRFIYRNTYVVPTPYPGNYNAFSYQTAPGIQSAVTTGVYPTPYGGFNSYYNTTTAIKPVYSGPFHSIVWDPTTLTYRYFTGTANTPNYSYYIPPAISPYATNYYYPPAISPYLPYYNFYIPPF